MPNALHGRQVVNTRAAQQAEELNALLREQGALPLAYPCIAITPPEDTAQMDALLVRLVEGNFDWLVLTSANTVNAIAQRLTALKLAIGATSFQVAAIGPATADAAKDRLGLEVAFLPKEYVAESLANDLPIEPGATILLPESAIAHPTVEEILAIRGAKVTSVTAYQTKCADGGVDVPQLLKEGQIDAITFTSSSTVACFAERICTEGGILATASQVCAACIGPKTAAMAHTHGFSTVISPVENTLEGLIEALKLHFTRTIA